MDDAELLRQALEALKDPSLDTSKLQSRIAARLAAIYSGGGTPTAEEPAEPSLDSTIPILPGR